MRGVYITAIGGLAAAVTAANSNITCATGLYILCARGSGELTTYPGHPELPPNTGGFGEIALAIAKQVNGSIVAGVDYPATNPVPDNFNLTDPSAIQNLNLTGYYQSENTGVSSILQNINQYHSSCPDSKIALIGYSQGAQVVEDALCGGTGGTFNSDAPLSPDLVKQNVVAVAVAGDPTHIANLTIDRGTAVHNGRFPRTNITVCQQYDDITASWCDKNDVFCDSGDSITVHESYVGTYATQIVEFVVEKYKNASSQSTPTPTPSSSATATSTSPPTSTTSSSSASVVSSGQSLSLGVAVLLAVCVLF
ncbi:cutinase-domain-containing protein [Talaromyces proteolyticus]|uniref:Cutinase-domain-containing protein n=1 Tax=Talaromyces proteolyticus TaxID=1131652 RepID=A0AAD4KL88_9EURO|nr:cutinase-domain-containing protein [Talaromyces proteolyticus]KAH8693973.1 cutinase-domain-containing protein [Talaromyces proteolyticus]